jgi:hypothetical protein
MDYRMTKLSAASKLYLAVVMTKRSKWYEAVNFAV